MHFIISIIFFIFGLIISWIIFLRQRIKRSNTSKKIKTIAFFHPYCTSGGGGERVLWKFIQVLDCSTYIVNKENVNIIIYTIDPPTKTYKQDVLKHVQERFSILISDKLQLSFIHLQEYKYLLQPASSFSLLMESIGVMRLAYIALSMHQNNSNNSNKIPNIFIDTTGYAFTYIPAVILYNCTVIAYVHYPTISTDMLQLVWERRRNSYNHQSYITKSIINTYIKLIYYIIFAILYGITGSLASVIMVNSTWTYNHIKYLWKYAYWTNKIRIVYPPCSIFNDEISYSDNKQPREKVIISIGQFRPEKDHILQIESMVKLLEKYPEHKDDCKLVMIGSCRGSSDESRLEYLKEFCNKTNLNSNNIEFIVNQPYSTIQEWLQKASIGIHTMWNEHFGIGIVEMMSAGLIVIAHNSGGPKSDIIIPLLQETSSDPNNNNIKVTTRTGYLASTADEYAEKIHMVLSLDNETSNGIRRNAQESAKRFTDEVFEQSVQRTLLEMKILPLQ